jgi:uncharacterized Tic20 family protein
MYKLLNDITTGKDNSTHEIIRVFAVVVMVLMVIICLIGVGMEVAHFIQTGQHDLQSFYQAQITLVLGLGTFFLTVATAIRIKAPNEPSDPPNVNTIRQTFEQTKTSGAPA